MCGKGWATDPKSERPHPRRMRFAKLMYTGFALPGQNYICLPLCLYMDYFRSINRNADSTPASTKPNRSKCPDKTGGPGWIRTSGLDNPQLGSENVESSRPLDCFDPQERGRIANSVRSNEVRCNISTRFEQLKFLRRVQTLKFPDSIDAIDGWCVTVKLNPSNNSPI